MTLGLYDELVLAIHPCARGVAFALFAGPLSPIDWGLKEIHGRDRGNKMLEYAIKLVKQLEPNVVVLDNRAGTGGQPVLSNIRIQRLIANYATGHAIDVERFTREEIRECFSGVGATTREEIAQAIAGQIHAFERFLPKRKKFFESKDPKLAVFDAASLAMTYYCRSRFCGVDDTEVA